MSARRKHYRCEAGAAVRLSGYCPARVVRVYPSPDFPGRYFAECVVTHRRAFANGTRVDTAIGPHGYRSGETVHVHAFEAVPRDCIHVMRGTGGRLTHHAFDIVPTPGAKDGNA